MKGSTKTRAAARQVCEEYGLERFTIFNDKLVGGRSLKVQGWRKEHYHRCRAILAEQGIESHINQYEYPATRFCPARTVYRLFVKEQ